MCCEGLVGEDEEAEYCDDKGYCALDDEEPLPAGKVGLVC